MKANVQGKNFEFKTIEEVFATCQAMIADPDQQNADLSAWCVKGDTFAYRESFKAMGFEWDSERKVWYVCKQNLIPQKRAMTLVFLLQDLRSNGFDFGMQVGEWR